MSETEEVPEEMDPSVPGDLLDLYVELELTGHTPEELAEWEEAQR